MGKRDSKEAAPASTATHAVGRRAKLDVKA
jgi:hypothetical protein